MLKLSPYLPAVLCLALFSLPSDPQTRTQTEPVVWKAIPLITKESKDAGVIGGEGGQWPRALAWSAADPNFAMMATDVGGIYRSFDAGKSWQVCMVGWNNRGGNALALDPKNADRLLGVAGNSVDLGNWSGVYLSTDRGASWKQVLPKGEANDDRESIAYDPASYNSKLGYCAIAYFSSKKDGIYRTEDGGATWKQVNPNFGNTILRVHPTKGIVYLAGEDKSAPGFFKSKDGGKTFQNLSKNEAFGMDVTSAEPNTVYLTRQDGVLVSHDSGDTFASCGNKNLPTSQPIRDIAASPANSRYLACWHRGDNYQWVRFYSHDGGANWTPMEFNEKNKVTKNAFLPFNVRNGIFAWSPKQANAVLGIGGDWVTKSVDGGATFEWSNSGLNDVMTGSSFAFSPTSPKTVFLSFQDYNAAFSLDGGSTWNYRDVSGNGWGGFEYGGFTIDGKAMWTGDAPSWGGPRRLKVSLDGGTVWKFAQYEGKDIVFAGSDNSYSDPTDPNIAFASNWRTADRGATWSPMPECDAVYAHRRRGVAELFGRKGKSVVSSKDHGKTWKKIFDSPAEMRDLAYDEKNERFWFAADDKLKLYENGKISDVQTPADQFGAVRVVTVAVDPQDTQVVYAGNDKDIYACDNAVVRSLDGGKTWANVTVKTPLKDSKMPGGPHEVGCLRVHPVTRELWAAGQCFGMWKLMPPGK